MKTGAAIFSMLMGLMMFGTWGFLFLTGRFPQIKTVPVEAYYLLVAEFLTAAALVAAGWGIFAGQRWALPLALLALGELIYCTIRFAGELGQEGSLPGLAFFTSVGVMGIFFAVYLLVAASREGGT